MTHLLGLDAVKLLTLCWFVAAVQFNLRETSNIISNLCRMTKDVHKQPLQVSDSLL